MKKIDIHTFFVNRDIDAIKGPFKESKRFFINFKNAINNKMYINKLKRIKVLLFIDRHIKIIISMDIFFKIVIAAVRRVE